MNCTDAKHQLDNSRDPFAGDTGLRAHLAQCSDCRSYAEDLRLGMLLHSLPVPPASDGFADRALQQAWQTANPADTHSAPRRSHHPMGWATAAVVLVAVLVVLQTPWRTGEPTDLPQMQVVQVAPNEVRQVDVMMVSGQALPNATITVRLDDNVGLAGYPNTSTLSWQTPIRVGSNKLSLPVQLLGETSGNIRIEIESGNARKEMNVLVEATGPLSGAKLLI